MPCQEKSGELIFLNPSGKYLRNFEQIELMMTRNNGIGLCTFIQVLFVREVFTFTTGPLFFSVQTDTITYQRNVSYLTADPPSNLILFCPVNSAPVSLQTAGMLSGPCPSSSQLLNLQVFEL